MKFMGPMKFMESMSLKIFAAKALLFSLGFLLLMSLLAQHGCSQPRSKKAVYMLVDMSGTYSQQFDKVQIVLRYLLGSLQPGESLALARIDSESFNEKDIVARMIFDFRPSMANAQKRAFLESVETFGKSIQPSQYTDITGGILQAIEYLNETRATDKHILIFSDLKEEIKKTQVRNFPISFNGIHVVAVNVTELQNDNIDYNEYSKKYSREYSREYFLEYQQRLEQWSQRVEQGGGDWKIINDLNHLSQIIE